MKPSILLLVFIVAAISSCTTAYKTGQTPDDVYYSPARPEEEYVRIENNDERKYRYDEDYYDDRYLRMKVRNRYRWSDLDDWYFYGKTYSYGYSYSTPWGYTWNPYTSWNYYYNPYCRSCCVNIPYTKTSTVYNKPRNFNLNTYNPPSNPTKIFNPSTRNSNTYSSPRNTRSSDNNDRGNILRDIFGSRDNNTSSGNSGSNTNSSSSGKSNTSSGSGKSTSAPVRKF